MQHVHLTPSHRGEATLACALEVAALDDAHQATLDALISMGTDARTAEQEAMAAAARAVDVVQSIADADGAGTVCACIDSNTHTDSMWQ